MTSDTRRYTNRHLKDATVEAYRVDRDPSVAVPIDSIERKIKESAIVLADITTHNPNVWYELGFAFATGCPVVMTCNGAAFSKLPFDVQHRHVVKYSTASPTDFERLRNAVTTRVIARLRDIEHARSTTETGRDPVPESSPRLSQSAKELLKAAALGGGRVLYTTHFGSPGSTIQAGERLMIPDDADHRTEVAWTGALRDLEHFNYIRDLGAGTVFELTPTGYATADELLPKSAQHRVWMELNHGYDTGGTIPLDRRALGIIERHGGKRMGGGWRFPDGTILPERDGRIVAA